VGALITEAAGSLARHQPFGDLLARAVHVPQVRASARQRSAAHRLRGAWGGQWHGAERCSVRQARASGGIGRRARFRSVCPEGCGGSTPPSRTIGEASDLRKRRQGPLPLVSMGDAVGDVYKELPYAIRRRRADEPNAERIRLSEDVRAIQSKLSYYLAWTRVEAPDTGAAYAELVQQLRRVAGMSMHVAWTEDALDDDAGMNIGLIGSISAHSLMPSSASYRPPNVTSPPPACARSPRTCRGDRIPKGERLVNVQRCLRTRGG
jgi:hypothetical protein